jgi:hypothetical protein
MKKKMKKPKDAIGSPHNMANQKSRLAKGKVVDRKKTTKADAPISHRTPNDFKRTGNAADQELDVMRGMDRTKQMLQRKKK